MDRDAKRDASAFRVLLDLSEEAKLPVDQLLAGIDVDRDSIYQPYAEIFMWQELAYIERLVERHVRFSLALTAASRVHITTLGTLGYAMLSCRNIFTHCKCQQIITQFLCGHAKSPRNRMSDQSSF